MIYFTSDQHFYDERIMMEAGRPFATPDEMNEELIARFTAKTADASEVYILGDIFGGTPPEEPAARAREIFLRLGIDRVPFHLMRGNHDRLSVDDYKRIGFASVRGGFAYIEAGGRRWMITHDPCMIQPAGTLAICGHIHTLFAENWQPARGTFTINVAVEARDYAPVSLAELEAIVAASPYRPEPR